MILPKIVLTDIDGVWTDGGMYYDHHGNELKKFNTRDSGGVLICQYLRIPIGIITGENTRMVEARAKKLNIDLVFQGITEKLSIGKSICEEYGISLGDVAYIGDDIGDYRLLKAVGFSGCPADAPDFIQNICTVSLSTRGGRGAFLEFVEKVTGMCLIDTITE